MIDLKSLRILIALTWLLYVGQVLLLEHYDPSLGSPLIQIATNELLLAVKTNHLFDIALCIESGLLIYSSAMLWFAYRAGVWAFVLYLIVSMLDNLFFSVFALSSLDVLFEDLRYLILGIILLSLFSSPVRETIAAPKPIYFWRILGMFFFFFALFFLVPLGR